MKAFVVALVVGVGLSVLVAAVPHRPVEETPDDLVVNAKVDARLKQVLSGLLRAQSEQATR
ncbi:MAG: hypothetical protein ACJ790_00190 [Myxococcaceae bacterium]